MPLRALRKALNAFAAFDSVAACRACATEAPDVTVIAPGREEKKAAEKFSSQDGSRSDAGNK